MESVVGSQDHDSDVPIISLVTPNKRRKKRRRKSPKSTSPESTPGAPKLDYELVANERIRKPPEKQQCLVPQQDDLTFDCSELPYNYISLPVETNFKLFEKFKCRKCHALKQNMLHGWSSDIVEGMNRFFTKFLPKDRTYAMTIKNQVRIHLAICIDSVGYQETYFRLAEATGLRLGSINENLNRLLNDEKQYRRKYRKRSYVKINRRWHLLGSFVRIRISS
jgi:hypothetical protein